MATVAEGGITLDGYRDGQRLQALMACACAGRRTCQPRRVARAVRADSRMRRNLVGRVYSSRCSLYRLQRKGNVHMALPLGVQVATGQVEPRGQESLQPRLDSVRAAMLHLQQLQPQQPLPIRSWQVEPRGQESLQPRLDCVRAAQSLLAVLFARQHIAGERLHQLSSSSRSCPCDEGPP